MERLALGRGTRRGRPPAWLAKIKEKGGEAGYVGGQNGHAIANQHRKDRV